MKRVWVVPNKKWDLRATQDGLELVTPEQNVALELSDPIGQRGRIASILSGRRKIPQGSENEPLRQMIRDLEVQGVLQLQEGKPTNTRRASKMERSVWELRSAFVGSGGPISTVYHLDPSRSSFNPLSSRFAIAKYTPFGEDGEEWAGGTDGDPLLAEFKAIMEALERWASGVVPQQELVKSSMQALGPRALDPRGVVAYAGWQYRRDDFPCVPFSSQREYFWKEVSVFPGESKRFLPVECLYYPIAGSLAPTPYTFANSSGIAAGFSFEGALVGGIYEAIERDAFMAAWLNRVSMPRMRNSTLPEGERARVARFAQLGYDFHVVNLTLDLAPVVLAIAVHHTKRPALVLGAASNLDLQAATAKAISEVERQLHWELRDQERGRIITDEKEVRGVADHMALYASRENLLKAEFLWQGPEVPYPGNAPIEKKHELEVLLEAFKSRGVQFVAADLTPPSLKEHGVWVARSIPLGLIPISFGYGMEPMGVPRIQKVAGKMKGWEGKPFTHPFA